jgi:hypothetical protein
MKIKDYHYNGAQLAVMSDNLLTEYMVQLLTDIAIYWDENDRDKQWLSMEEVMDIHGSDQTHRQVRENLMILRHNELMESRGGGKCYRVSLTPDGEAAAKYILDSKDKRRYVRLTTVKEYPGRGQQRMYTTSVWNEMLVAFAAHIVKVDTRKQFGETAQRQIFVDCTKLPDVLEFLDRAQKVKPKQQPNMPKILLDKIAIYQGKDLPSWLQFEIKQHSR